MPEAEDLEPVYLTLEDALELYAAIIDGSPTQARDQLRSRAGLQGALERPASHAHYESADLALQAAVLGGLKPSTLHEDWGRYSPKARKPAWLAGWRLLSGGGGI